jgi:hypothetical protein
MKKIYSITKSGVPIKYGSDSKVAWCTPKWPLMHLKQTTLIRGLSVKCIDFETDTVTTWDAISFLGMYEDPRLKKENLALALGRCRSRPYTMDQMKSMLTRGKLEEEQATLVKRYLELHS